MKYDSNPRAAARDRTLSTARIGAVAAALFLSGLSPLASAAPSPSASPTVQPRVVEAVVEDVENADWTVLTAQGWSEVAAELWEGALALDRADDASLRPLLFRTWTQAGRAAENANTAEAPFFAKRGGKMVNDAWFRAGAMLVADPSLGAQITDSTARASVTYYADAIRAGELPRTSERDFEPRQQIDETVDLSSTQWTDQAYSLRKQIMAMEEAGTSRTSDGSTLFGLLLECGYAAARSGNPSPPLFDAVLGDDRMLNVCWYRVASMMEEDARLTIDDAPIAQRVEVYREYIRNGERPIAGLSKW